ncbi:PilW family protein [Iodobacter ciconiae]|uniref:Prepilin-type N-terminal cleavage/methylation domain-containing protein n=1 Tax=Iodobacter ciconiae TaxID=2496266 RepID=A0A3S8ZXB0_9NEIS|nr:PilW family protein [Iodobacter ciconiae]AZN38140.1 prepilin-type N-terminal cleavage/methylation domain-containing protein [Iodobacter ciconiae]
MRPSYGFGLIEIMVAIVISLLASLAIYQTFNTSEGFRRSTLGNGNAQSSGGIAVMQIQKELERAGYGIGSNRALNCNVVSQNTNYTDFPLVPVLITPMAGSDQISMLYSTSPAGGMPALFGQGTTHTNNDNQFVNLLLASQFNAGDLVVVWPDPGRQAQTPCPLFQVTCVNAGCVGAGTPAAEKDFLLRHANNALWNGTAVNRPFPASLPLNTTRLFNFGTMIRRTYCVYLAGNPNQCRGAANKTDGSLISMDVPKDRATDENSWTSTAENVVQLRAQYGFDTNRDGDNIPNNINDWSNTTPANLLGWQQLIAIRYGALVRSNYPEKPQRDGSCTTTASTATFAWAGGNFSRPANAQPSNTSWQCYRYTVHEAVVPLRNQLLINQPNLISTAAP